MEFERCRYDTSSVTEYADLFRACFPTAAKLADPAYLRWLYTENPCGNAVGFNARVEGRLAAHYVCVPADILVGDRPIRALLSLNTATHPDFQGKGLFTRLAELTYENAAADGFDLVYGVANANSTPGFVRKLGFALVAPLESRVGLGRLGRFDWGRLSEIARFRHAWSAETLAWRMRNPAGRISMHASDGDVVRVSAATGRWAMRAWAEIPMSTEVRERSENVPVGLRVWLGLLPAGFGRMGLYHPLPQRLRPSPLNLIVRGLQTPFALAPEEVFFNFLDFDAF